MSRNNTAMAHTASAQPTIADCDALLASLDALLDLDATLTIPPEENRRLLASAFPAPNESPHPSTDDAITLVASSPLSPLAFRTRSPVRITPELARAARELRACEDARRRYSRAASPAVRQRDSQVLVVAGIWAMALSLAAMLAIMVTG